MNEQQTLKKLADLFHVAPSALRYWDNEGLIRFERSTDNNYRMPTWKTMLDICDVILNRSLSIPVKSIRELPKMNADQQLKLLADSEAKLLNQIKEIEETLSAIQHKKALLENVKQLEVMKDFMLVEVKIPSIRSFSFESKEDMELFIYDPSRSAILLLPQGACLYGMFTDNEQDELFRAGDKALKRYLKGLLKLNSDDASINNASVFYEAATARNLKTGSIIGKYMGTAFDQDRTDYYEAWLEIID